jgi:hypothetical protein
MTNSKRTKAIQRVVLETFQEVAEEIKAAPPEELPMAAIKVAPHQLSGVLHSIWAWPQDRGLAACLLARAREYAFEIPDMMEPYIRRRLKISNITAMRVSRRLSEVVDGVVVVQGGAPALFSLNGITTQWTVDLIVFDDPIQIYIVRSQSSFPVNLPSGTVLRFMSQDYCEKGDVRIIPLSNDDMPDDLVEKSSYAEGGVLCEGCPLRHYCSW